MALPASYPTHPRPQRAASARPPAAAAVSAGSSSSKRSRGHHQPQQAAARPRSQLRNQTQPQPHHHPAHSTMLTAASSRSALASSSSRGGAAAAPRSSSSSSRGASLVASARPTKAADFRGLDNAEIVTKIDELKREKMRLQYMQKTRGNILNPGSENNPEAVQIASSDFKHVRRQIAQLMTLLRERELADGITRKQSRAMRKEVAVAGGFARL